MLKRHPVWTMLGVVFGLLFAALVIILSAIDEPLRHYAERRANDHLVGGLTQKLAAASRAKIRRVIVLTNQRRGKTIGKLLFSCTSVPFIRWIRPILPSRTGLFGNWQVVSIA